MGTPVFKRLSDGTLQEIRINFDDIVRSTKANEITYVYNDKDEEFIWVSGFDDLDKLEGFEKVHRLDIVRMDKVKRYDKENDLIHFHETEFKPCVAVSRRHKQKLKPYKAILKRLLNISILDDDE